MTPFTSLAQAPLAHAPEEPSESIELMKEEESVSIAARHEQPISQAPQNVYVITDEDIRQSGAIDLPTVLRRVPGIEVMQMSGADFNVSARGDNQTRANKMLVLVDGRSVYLDVQGEVLWKMIPITLPEIKRIEVLKGPASALYGFNAFDGVINIITKSGEEMKGATVQFGGGEYGTIMSSAIYGGKQGKVGYRLSAGHEQNNQWDNRNSLAFRVNKFNGDISYDLPGDATLRLSGGLADSNRYNGPITDVVEIQQKPGIGYANAVYERPNFFIRAWWTRYTQPQTVTTNPLIANSVRILDRTGTTNFQDLQANSSNIEAQHAIEIWSANRFTYGFNYRANQVSSNFLNTDAREERLGIYIQDEWKATSTLTAVAGLRYDIDTFINPTFSPRFSLIYTPNPNHSFRATAAVAYRPPTIFETHNLSRGQIPITPAFSINTVLNGSNNLQPEKMISYDLGYQGWFLKHRLLARADLFFNHISQLIGRTSGSTTLTFFNSPGQADIYGGEAGVEFLATTWLTGFANYSYQEIGQSFTGTFARGAPKHKANVGLRGEWQSGFSGEVAYHYYGAATYPVEPFFVPRIFPTATQRVGSYNLLNLRGAYRFWQQKAVAGYRREAEVAVTAFSALNDKHQEHPLGEIIGSRVMGWLTLRF
jgi:iron complex outermembrane recepter protein